MDSVKVVIKKPAPLEEGQVPYLFDVNHVISIQKLWDEVEIEVAEARLMFPWWPKDIVHAAAIVAEEAGEVLKAANEIRWQHKSTNQEDLKKEIIQTIAMCVRLWQESLYA